MFNFFTFDEVRFWLFRVHFSPIELDTSEILAIYSSQLFLRLSVRLLEEWIFRLIVKIPYTKVHPVFNLLGPSVYALLTIKSELEVYQKIWIKHALLILWGLFPFLAAPLRGHFIIFSKREKSYLKMSLAPWNNIEDKFGVRCHVSNKHPQLTKYTFHKRYNFVVEEICCN